MMLYIGPLCDLWPVKRYSYAHKDFVYIDGLPGSKYFRPDQAGWQVSKDKEAMVSCIRDDLRTDNALVSDEELPHDVHVFRLRGGTTLTYYFNRKDHDIPTDPLLKKILPQVTAIYIHGPFQPVLPPLPSLKKCYYTELCSGIEMPETVSTIIIPEVEAYYEDSCYRIRCDYCWKQLERLEVLNGRFVVDFDHVSEEVKGWTNLQDLKLRYCEALPSGSRFWTNLRSLKLETLTAAELSADAAGEWKDLQELVLNSCPMLQRLPRGVSSWKGIQRVEIRSAPLLSALPSEVRAWVDLQKLLLGWCQGIMELPPAVGSWKRLKQISLCDLSLCELPAAVGEWRALVSATISNCKRLVRLPLEVAGWSKLRSFTLSGCDSVLDLSEGVSGWTELQNLQLLRCAALASLPKGVGSWISLRAASIYRCNQLKGLPGGTQKWSALEDLTLSECSSLGTLQAGQPAKGGLACLNVSLRPPTRSQSWESLTRLNLYDIEIDRLPESVERCVRLRSVDVDRCRKLWDLSAGVKGWRNLEQLNITRCEGLRSLPEGVGQWKQLQAISFNMSLSNLVLPKEVGAWVNLENAYFGGLVALPQSADGWTSLKILSINDLEVETLPESAVGAWEKLTTL
ncbi:hypothetical protein KFL_007800020 [Klebsormidium nitens]|uniref:Uncharacterized protein n=1 Tax=Klebsormidium nitens TaxID=105231 RepID=A0A1Y1IKL6_KLENI|nr:hypothetical protein KFL_007800020 [Klebsormidium nitens]|eukprot:GAQ91415.1 hypothetical protein KFL_007800020 [Klebsormidium nitens]